MDQAVSDYIDAMPAEHRALFDRIHRIIVEICPDVAVVLSYKMPTYQCGDRRLHVGVWKHGVSLYGWRDEGFLERHPHLRAARGTIRLRPQDAEEVTDDELRDLARTSLSE